MQKVSDSVTSIFKLETKEEPLAKCLQGGSTIVYSEKFGLGWRFGLQYFQEGWSFAKVKVYLDHTHCSPSVTDTARVSVYLKDGPTREVPSFDSKTVSIADFGRGPPALIGSFSPYDIAAHPYMWFTVAIKANFAPVIADPLINTASALRQSMNNGEFIDTKYYAMSKRATWKSSGETRFVYANSAGLEHGAGVAPVLPSSIEKNSLLVHYDSENMLMMDTTERYDYYLDSDIDSEEEEVEEKTKTETVTKEKAETKAKGKEQGVPTSEPPPYHYSQSYIAGPGHYEHELDEFSDALSDITSDSSALSSDDDHSIRAALAATRPPGFRSTDTLRTEPSPQPFSPTQRMVLVRNTALTTWASYVYYCYTGHISSYPLKSKDPLSRRNNTTQTLCCSPKSMYRLASKLKNARLEALARQAIKSNLSSKNILDEAFSWFTAQYPDIEKMELELLIEFRSTPEVSNRLDQILESVFQGERPYAKAMLSGFLMHLTRQGAGGRSEVATVILSVVLVSRVVLLLSSCLSPHRFF
ncbi:uncharacterized protein F5147DRAFT_103138 [Suillus discolor]|uniref:Uncharacterized protein n=1 Tax=Suillus discolor TaxID=1912936 RepID=A0A9P7FC16_9AGAM|nr:uncharacterized protein F5147DRAFT_103138 [Suillus discolor]KAG2111310.1 hypothetical protein F5147DRAFT_103138 [Suillus discolor]